MTNQPNFEINQELLEALKLSLQYVVVAHNDCLEKNQPKLAEMARRDHDKIEAAITKADAMLEQEGQS